MINYYVRTKGGGGEGVGGVHQNAKVSKKGGGGYVNVNVHTYFFFNLVPSP